MIEPILRATNDAGDTYDDPSEDLLFILLEELDEANTFLIVERVEPGREGHFMQVALGQDGSYALEYREGGPETHYGTSSTSMRLVHEAMSKWAHDVRGWHEIFEWTPVRY